MNSISKSRNIRRKLLTTSSIALLSLSTVAFAQMQGGSPQQGMQQQQQQNQQQQQQLGQQQAADSGSGNPQQAMVDHEFVKKALEGGDAEVQLGQLAEQKSQSNDVKQFAQKMVDDHTKMDDQIKPLAQQMGVKEPKSPSKKDKELMAKLQGLSGDQFDQTYIQAMLKDHKQDLKDFKDEAQMTQDPNVKQLATQGYGVISQHYQMIQQIAQAHNVPTDGKAKSGL